MEGLSVEFDQQQGDQVQEGSEAEGGTDSKGMKAFHYKDYCCIPRYSNIKIALLYINIISTFYKSVFFQ